MQDDINDVEYQIIQLLKKNARLPVNSIAQAVGVSRLTAQKKIKKLEETGQILGYTCLLYTSPSPRDLSTSRMPSSA